MSILARQVVRERQGYLCDVTFDMSFGLCTKVSRTQD